MITTELPSILSRKHWRVSLTNPGGSAFSLAAGQSREVQVAVTPGAEVSQAEVMAATDRDVVMYVEADGILIGGMSYRLDPNRAHALPQPQGDCAERDCSASCAKPAQDLLRCLELPGYKARNARVRRIGVDIDVDDC